MPRAVKGFNTNFNFSSEEKKEVNLKIENSNYH